MLIQNASRPLSGSEKLRWATRMTRWLYWYRVALGWDTRLSRSWASTYTKPASGGVVSMSVAPKAQSPVLPTPL